jgi:hypothetical protein
MRKNLLLVLSLSLSLLSVHPVFALLIPEASLNSAVAGAFVQNGENLTVAQVTATPVSTFSPGEQATDLPARTAPPLWLTLTLLGMCCVFLVLIGVVVLGFVVRRQNRESASNNTPKSVQR